MKRKYTRFCVSILILATILSLNINLVIALDYHYNRCRETNTWQEYGDYNPNFSIDYADSQEGDSSTEYNNLSELPNDGIRSNYTTIAFNDYPNSSGTKVLGLWYKLITAPLPSLITFGFAETANEDYEIGSRQQIIVGYDRQITWNGFHRITLNLNEWYWFQLMYQPVYNAMILQINGTGGGSFYGNSSLGGLDMGSTCMFRFSRPSGNRVGRGKFDLIRISDALEYPPTNPLFEVETLIYLNEEIMTTGFNPIRIEGSYYGTGRTISLAYGEYNLACDHARLTFVSWNLTGYDAAYFGYNQIGAYNTTNLNNDKMGAYGQNYTLPYTANVTHITAYTWTTSAQTNGTYGIYQIQGHDITNAVLMGSTEEFIGINTTMLWRTFTFTGGLVLEAGSYVIAQHTAGNGSTPAILGTYAASTVDNFQNAVDDTYSDGLEPIFGAGGSNISSTIVSCYAVYQYLGLSVDNSELAETTLNVHGSGVLVLYVTRGGDLMNLYTWIVLFLASLFLMVWSPAWFAWKIKKVGVTVESIERLGYATLLFLVGFGLLIMCIYA